MNIWIPMLGLTPHGGNRVLVAIANALVQAGHQCTIVCPVHEPNLPFVLDSRVSVKQIGVRIRNKVLRWVFFIIQATVVLRGKYVLANHFLTALSAQLADGLASRRTVYLVQDIEFKFYPGFIRSLAKWLCQLTYRLPNLLPANRYLENELKGFGYSCLRPVDLGIAPVFFLQPKTTTQDFDVVYFLRRDHHKRLDRFEAIWEQLRLRGISVVGISQDEELLARFRPRLTAVRRPANDMELVNVLDSARLLLLTSDQEGFSLPPLEGMARGLPAVMFPCGGPSVYVRHGENAEIVATETADAAASAIERILGMPEYYALLSNNARLTSLEFSFEKGLGELIPRLIQIWRDSGNTPTNTTTANGTG